MTELIDEFITEISAAYGIKIEELQQIRALVNERRTGGALVLFQESTCQWIFAKKSGDKAKGDSCGAIKLPGFAFCPKHVKAAKSKHGTACHMIGQEISHTTVNKKGFITEHRIVRKMDD